MAQSDFNMIHVAYRLLCMHINNVTNWSEPSSDLLVGLASALASPQLYISPPTLSKKQTWG